MPAHNEQDEICGCLKAITAAIDRLATARSGGVRAHVVVILDDRHDRTSELVSTLRQRHRPRHRCHSVGIARRVGADHLPTTGIGAEWIANADTDSRVKHNLLARMIDHADAGADVVLGGVRPSTDLPLLCAQWLGVNLLGDGHPHVHGANLGIRASSCRTLGGWAQFPIAQDVDLVDRPQRLHMQIRRCGDVVTTAAHRRSSPRGFSTTFETSKARPDWVT